MNHPLTSFLPGPPSELDPSFCARERIDIPGAIQPHGALLAARADNWLVTHASANLEAILDQPVAAVLGHRLEEAIGGAAFQMLQAAGTGERILLGFRHSISGTDGRILHLSAHRSGPRICIDIEPTPPESVHKMPMTVVQSVLETFKHATSQIQLCELAIRGLKTITGFDRVMVYRFGEEGHGEVIAEVHAEQLEPYFGNHYPHTDIPAQARQQYLRQRVGAIADSSYTPVPLLVARPLDDGTPLDLTYSALRSVSPIHREFMRNMGTAASLSIGLAYEKELWGMLICHHGTARIVDPEMRAMVDMIGQVVSLLLGTLAEAEICRQRLDRDASLRRLVSRLSAPGGLPEALEAVGTDLLHLVNASGALVRIGAKLVCLGRMPSLPLVQRALGLLQHDAGEDVLAVDDLGLRYSELGECISEASGALLLPLAPGFDNLILWLRPELSRVVTWAGNPTKEETTDAVTGEKNLSPRTSFAAWKQVTNGRSAPWTQADRTLARALRSAIEIEVAQRAKTELAWLSHYQKLSEDLELKVEERSRALQAETEERQKAEVTLLQSEKMEAVGQLTGGVAHDFNNVLAAVLGNLELARAHSRDPVLDRFLMHAQHAAERGAKLTDHLLSFARKQPLRREPCQLNGLSLHFNDLITRAIGPTIEIRMDLADDLWTVMADSTQFEMALLNLAVNARDAMPEGGKLVISTANIAARSPKLPSDLDPGDYACLSVQDTGTGMTAEIASRAFEPFYTTKPVGKGTGLGLSQVYGFCKQLGGTATISSAPGAGTRVDLLFPRAAQTPAVAVPAPVLYARPLPDAHTVGARLLVIDDDPEVLDVTVDTLRSLGFDVVPMESARLGLELLNKGMLFDLVVTDFSMPDMNGLEFIRRVHVSHPDLPCLLVTGYADISSSANALAGDIMILRKPYRMKQLAATVEQLLVGAVGQGQVGGRPAPQPTMH